MPIEENIQKEYKLPGVFQQFAAASMKQERIQGQGTHRKCPQSANELSPDHKSTQTRSQAPASEKKWMEEDLQAFPGNTLAGPLHSPSGSAQTEVQRSPGSSTNSPKPRDYWDTVLGPFDMDLLGNTNPSSTSKPEKPYHCSICPSTFKKRCNLLTHISNVHEKIRPFLCPICFRRFARKSNCVKHVSFAPLLCLL